MREKRKVLWGMVDGKIEENLLKFQRFEKNIGKIRFFRKKKHFEREENFKA